MFVVAVVFEGEAAAAGSGRGVYWESPSVWRGWVLIVEDFDVSLWVGDSV